jgi:group I intron endonuclease
MSCGIYKITNKINNKVYIGQSINIQERWRNERSRCNQVNSDEYESHLSRAFRLYGLENFSFEILEECSVEKLDELEKKYIKQYSSYLEEKGYNVTLGGQGTRKTPRPSKYDYVIELLSKNYDNKTISKMTGVSWRSVSDLNCGACWKDETIDYPIRKNSSIRWPKGTKPMTKEKSKKNLKPSKEELENDFSRLKQNNEFSLSSLTEKYNVTEKTIRKWAESYNLLTPWKEKISIGKNIIKKNNEEKEKFKIIQFDENGKELNRYKSAADAARAINVDPKNSSHILDTCRGKRPSAYGYSWKFVD